jgi:hypothetical protein
VAEAFEVDSLELLRVQGRPLLVDTLLQHLDVVAVADLAVQVWPVLGGDVIICKNLVLFFLILRLFLGALLQAAGLHLVVVNLAQILHHVKVGGGLAQVVAPIIGDHASALSPLSELIDRGEAQLLQVGLAKLGAFGLKGVEDRLDIVH